MTAPQPPDFTTDLAPGQYVAAAEHILSMLRKRLAKRDRLPGDGIADLARCHGHLCQAFVLLVQEGVQGRK